MNSTKSTNSEELGDLGHKTLGNRYVEQEDVGHKCWAIKTLGNRTFGNRTLGN